jgi:hypothetical protein
VRNLTRPAPFVLVVVLLVLAACSSSDYETDPPPPTTPLQLLPLFGNGLITEVGDTSLPLQLWVLDLDHRPVPGVAVTWSVAAGLGAAIPLADTTDATGIARARFLATADTGTRVVTARVAGSVDSAWFTLRVLPPCAVGRLATGQVLDTTFADGPCRLHQFDLLISAGQAYFITQTHQADSARGGLDQVDPILALWQITPGIPIRADRGRFLTFSDDEGGDRNAELFLVAPENGSIRIVAGTFGGSNGLGGSRLAIATCPVIPVTATMGTATYQLSATSTEGCLRHRTPGGSAYRFLSVPIRASERLTIRVTSEAFTPVWDAFANWDVYGFNDGLPGTVVGSGSTRIVTADQAGIVTIAIGGSVPTATGEFSLTIAREGGGTSPASDAGSSQPPLDVCAKLGDAAAAWRGRLCD